MKSLRCLISLIIFLLFPSLLFGQGWTPGSVTVDMIQNAGIANADLADWLADFGAGDFTGSTDVDIVATAGDVNITASGDDVVITATDDVVIQGQGSGDIITLAGGGTSVDLTVADNLITVASGTNFTLAGGEFVIPDGQTAGFVVQNATNTACNSTCTVSGCLIGLDSGGGTGFVSCASATADSCLCAGDGA